MNKNNQYKDWRIVKIMKELIKMKIIKGKINIYVRLKLL